MAHRMKSASATRTRWAGRTRRSVADAACLTEVATAARVREIQSIAMSLVVPVWGINKRGSNASPDETSWLLG